MLAVITAAVDKVPTFTWSLGICPPTMVAVILTNVPVNITCTRRPPVARTVDATLKSTPVSITVSARVKAGDTIITMFSVGFMDARRDVGAAGIEACNSKFLPDVPVATITVSSPTPIS